MAAIIITGGKGFIGTHLASTMEKQRPYIWDRKIPDQPWLDETVALLSKTTIIHLAASTYLTPGYDHQIISDNIILANTVRQLALKRKSRVIYASSAAVYNLNNLYAYSKKYNEDIFSDCNATGLRFYNVYGPNDNGVVGKLIKCAFTGKHFMLNGGNQVRDFVYVDDVVKSITDNLDSPNKIVEVGTGVGTSLNKLIKLIEELTHKKIKIIKCGISKFEQKKSICPKPMKEFISLREGINLTIKKYKIDNNIK